MSYRLATRAALLSVLLSSVSHAQMGPANVQVAPVELRKVHLTQPLVASVEPVTRSTLAAEEAWLVAERMFDEGQRVEKGAVLVRGNAELIQSQRNAAEAARVSAVARLEQAKAELENAKSEVGRIRRIAQNNVASEKEMSDAETREKVAIAIVDVRGAEIAEKKAEVDRLDLVLKRTQVVAPFAGIIARRHVEVGQWVEVGDAVADLVQTDPLFVRVNVPESVIARVNVGDEAEVQFDALGGQKLTGKVDQILPVADMGSRTFAVKVLLPNPEMRIRPGFFGRGVLTSASEAPRPVVPRDAVVTRSNGSHVVVARDGKAVVVPVERGPADGNMMAVSGDLKEGELVVTRGNEALRGGEPLAFQPPATQPVAAAAADR
jgi:RND family efflux transporter MFP subunit